MDDRPSTFQKAIPGGTAAGTEVATVIGKGADAAGRPSVIGSR